MEWFGLEGTLQTSCSNHPAVGRNPFHQSVVSKALSTLALNTAREGAATDSLSNLGQGLTTLTGKNFIIVSS